VRPGVGDRAGPGAGTAEPASPPHAGVVTRVLAGGVDLTAVVLLTAVLDLSAAGLRFVSSPRDFTWPAPGTPVSVTALLVVAVGYLTIGWATAGRTTGARLLGLRVLSRRHELLGWTRSAARAVACVVWPLGLLWCGISRSRLSVADLLVGSVVVYDVAPYARVRPRPGPAGTAA
jgi:uncharacterized RDD family membrane protein YckC